MKTDIRVYVLPGMDGTGDLLREFVEALPESFNPETICYPGNVPYTYPQLEEFVASRLCTDRPFVLIGESFSGPIAVRLAARGIDNLLGIVLVATFVRSPLRWLPSIAKSLILSVWFRILPPEWFFRRFLAGSDSPAKLLAELRAVHGRVTARVLATRAREILAVDASDALTESPIPILYVGGARDRIVPPSQTVPELQKIQPALKSVLMDAPHLVLQRRPQEAADAVARFIENSIDRSSP